MYTHEKQLIRAGKSAAHASKAVVLLHGRGSSAPGILSLARHLQLDDALLLAPQATNNSWYPYSFLAPVADNQPALDSALALVGEAVAAAKQEGIPTQDLYFVGFSQGACLALEYVARHAQPYGGIVAFTGGLIGESLDLENYAGDFAGTPVLITSGDDDPHVPLHRIEESVAVLRNLGATVTTEIYPGKPHSISPDETLLANKMIFGGNDPD
ncbi:alpha/beta hydrolase [Parapedobacter sp. 10938]|uniref:alpha/beta hydrolase n=1 Tax=Parapedobacter flavus TaxID=3110225 RepID=UPI002DBAD3C5|nr:dienelactone hydrolase family protein [Parapedobacter sp. 10938]MEC3879253.1 dienelactone hydrolase family protein [Parapedobacter sp. 10938]